MLAQILGRRLTLPEVGVAREPPRRTHTALWLTGSAVTLVASVAVLVLALLPPQTEKLSGVSGRTGDAGVPVIEARLVTMLGTSDDDGRPLVGDLVADGAEVEQGSVLLFRVSTTCSGYPHIIVERERGQPEVLWHAERRLGRGERTLEAEGMALGLQTGGESGRLLLHLVITNQRVDDAVLVRLLETTDQGVFQTGECWAHDSTVVHVRQQSEVPSDE